MSEISLSDSMKKKIIFSLVAVFLVGGIVWFIQNKMGGEQSINEDKNASEGANTESLVRTQREASVVDTSDWLIEKNDAIDFSFKYPQKAKIIDEGNCYRVEYELGFVIFFLPVDGDMRCGARTGVGVLPDNVDVTDYLTIGGEGYEAPGFEATVDTKGERFFKPDTRYFYDFHHMFDLNKEKNCGNASGCKRVGYGIYKEASAPLSKEYIDSTMNTLRAIVESVNVPTPKQ
jgi:hypothetical protein